MTHCPCPRFHRSMKFWDFHGGKTPQLDFAENFPKIRVDRPSVFRYRGMKETERERENTPTPVPEGCRRFSATPYPPPDQTPTRSHATPPPCHRSTPHQMPHKCPTNAANP